MGEIPIDVQVCDKDDVIVSIDTGSFLDAVASANEERQEIFASHIEALCVEHEVSRWYFGAGILRAAIARTLEVEIDHVDPAAGVCTNNSENHLSDQYSASVWDITGPSATTLVTIESRCELGFVDPIPELRDATMHEPIADLCAGYDRFEIACSSCAYSCDFSNEFTTWSDYTRFKQAGEDACGTGGDEVHEGLFCPDCEAPAAVFLYVGLRNAVRNPDPNAHKRSNRSDSRRLTCSKMSPTER